MNNIAPDLEEDYERWRNRFPDHPDANVLVSVDDVLRGHYLLVDYFRREGEPISICGPRDTQLLPSAVYRQATGYAGKKKWDARIDQCASLFYGIIKTHPFHDGNKRTALLMTLFGLAKLQRTPTAPEKEFEELALRTAGNQLEYYTRFRGKGQDADVQFIADFLRRNTRAEDSRYYVVTYADLDRVLKKHGFRLERPHDNLVTVVKTEQIGGFLGIGRKTREKRIVSIGCPRWTGQINQKALKSVLRETGLTPKSGYDSQVLFKDAEPLVALIDTYREPLRRLRDK
ncbi:MAG: Fic family protein [Phycisphaerae bacterium]|nr:Fic family protein [Phycisphaerae bacterium]